MLSQAANHKQELAVMQNFDKKKETEKASIQKWHPFESYSFHYTDWLSTSCTSEDREASAKVSRTRHRGLRTSHFLAGVGVVPR